MVQTVRPPLQTILLGASLRHHEHFYTLGPHSLRNDASIRIEVLCAKVARRHMDAETRRPWKGRDLLGTLEPCGPVLGRHHAPRAVRRVVFRRRVGRESLGCTRQHDKSLNGMSSTAARIGQRH